MENTNKVNNFTDRNVIVSEKYVRRTSASGFEHPKDLSYMQCPINLAQIIDAKFTNQLPITINGNPDRKADVATQNFYSESNLNFPNRNQFNNQPAVTLDSRYTLNNFTSIPRFTSTPMIPQNFSQNQPCQIGVIQLPINYNQSFPPTSSSNVTYNPQINCNSFMSSNSDSVSYMPSFVLCDPNTLNHQDLIYYAPVVQSTNSEIDENDFLYNKFRNDSYTNSYQHMYQEPMQQSELEESCFKCQLSLNPESFEINQFPEYAKNEPMCFMPPDLTQNNADEINRAETQSLPSLHGDGSTDSDLETTENERLNTVHGDEMLQELKKMTSVFTDVVELRSHSRFKKTRIEERTAVWRNQRFIVKDNMVKVIPENVLNTNLVDHDRLDKMALDILGLEYLAQTVDSKLEFGSPQCLHSVCRCRSAPADARHPRHSYGSHRKYRTSFNSLSPNDINTTYNISGRRTSRNSQIPIRIPIVPYHLNSMISPAVHKRTRMFFEQTNISNGRNNRRPRRWSGSDSKLERGTGTYGMRPQTLRPFSDLSNPTKSDFDCERSFELGDLNETSGDYISEITDSLESKLDNQLKAIKRTLLSCVESNLTESREEIQFLRGTKTGLEKQLNIYKEKVQILENLIRSNLPEDKWELYGIINCSTGNQL